MNSMPEHLTPPPTKGHVSVARLSSHWYVVCRSHELARRPLSRIVLGIPLVLFRDAQGRPAALLDRCPHRNVPLSIGRVTKSGVLECAYHGWQFEGGGSCVHVPGLRAGDNGKERRAPAFPTREQEGFIWVYATPDAVPASAPFELGNVGRPEYTSVIREVEVEATLHAAVENALDVPHTAYLHKGLFRGGDKHEVSATVRRSGTRVEAEYRGEPRPEGIVGRLLSPSGGIVEHWDRFILPSIAQVEYRLGSETHFLVTSLCTPVSDFKTRMFAVVQFRTLIPGRLLKLVLEPIALRIFAQDARILAQQTANVRRFGGEQYMTTEIDILGSHIWRLLKHAERGEAAEEAVVEREVRFLA
ncbi:MAG TPA: aromatic ring-hydroxylating dioxygenase subunit alpha [Polyangiaceae bacterium]|nr:aromatic ring-hydroxylating dioxygenase subunit alpha [Polyangiaceae bacterium]